MMWSKLRTFHHSIVRAISIIKFTQDQDQDCIQFPSISATLTRLNLDPIEDYIYRRRETLYATIHEEGYDHSVLDTCKAAHTPIKKTMWWNM